METFLQFAMVTAQSLTLNTHISGSSS